jgi:competence protein ComEA
MNRLRAWIRSYFGFSRTETNGFLILLPLMAMLVLSEPIYRWWLIHHPSTLVDHTRELDSLIAQWKWHDVPDSSTINPPQLFSFNPNTATQTDFLALGLPEKVTHGIMNYRSKGGKFRVRRDFRKIYGMDSALVKRLEQFVDLPEKLIPVTTAFTQHRPKPSPNHALFDLNQADSTQLIGIYGIGSKLSKRIITYRTRLGGFIAMRQLYEVYGLDSTTIEQLRKRSFIDQAFKPHQINVNKADNKELTTLPYIKFNLAKAITAYRFQHGDFQSVDELQQLMLLDEKTFQKIKPYLTVKD